MSAVLPGDIGSEPNAKLIFNAPFDQQVAVNFRLTNESGKKIGWAIKTNNTKRFGVQPPCGVLEPKQRMILSVTMQPFDIESEDTSNDRITVEWTDAPVGAGNKFQREWFQGSCIIRRKVVNCQYNV